MKNSLYIHIPFCKHICNYCDFNTFSGVESLIPRYIDAIIEEIRIVSAYLAGNSIHTIYFGGGTPSLVPSSLYKNVLAVICDSFDIEPGVEISIETNPGTISLPYLAELKTLGFNRLSIGVQSTDAYDLKRLDRIHNNEDTLISLINARRVGFDNINLDMIFNLPWQDLNAWEYNFTRAIDLKPEHFSVYSLIIEPGTLFYSWHQKGLIEIQNQDLEADMYEISMRLLKKAGYRQYEISNWAKNEMGKDYRCKHNLQYWYNLPYIGVGAGSHSYLNHTRTENVRYLGDYFYRVAMQGNLAFRYPETSATIYATKVDKMTQMKDTMWLGLRLVDEGVKQERFLEMHDCSMWEVFQKEIEQLESWGLVNRIKKDGGALRLTKRGVMLANQVFMQFV